MQIPSYEIMLKERKPLLTFWAWYSAQRSEKGTFEVFGYIYFFKKQQSPVNDMHSTLGGL